MTLLILIATGLICYELGKNSRLERSFETLDINNEGEKLVIETLKKNFKKPDHYLTNNITLPLGLKDTTQIDHILINKKGIFVIETKHYSGWIFGSKKSFKWTQSFKNGEKFQFLNPINQNEHHIKKIQKYLTHLNRDHFISVVVFTGEGTIKTKRESNVIYLEELTSFIDSHKEEKLRQTEIHLAIGRIEFYRKEISKETDLEHIKNLKSKLTTKRQQHYFY